MPIVFRHDQSADGEARENDRREIVDRELPELNHESENAGESPRSVRRNQAAFILIMPGAPNDWM